MYAALVPRDTRTSMLAVPRRRAFQGPFMEAPPYDELHEAPGSERATAPPMWRTTWQRSGVVPCSTGRCRE